MKTNTKKPVILFVDDRIIEHHPYVFYISKMIDCSIIRSYNGKDAIEKVKKNKPDLILLDLMMPQMDGFDVCIKIREFKRELPIIILTNKLPGAADEKRAYEVGANDYIYKPIAMDVLVDRIESALKRI